MRAFFDLAHQVLGIDLREMRLCGSRARGQDTRTRTSIWSAVVTEAGRALRHALYDLAYDIGLAHGVELAPLVLDERRLGELRARERRVARDIDVEGVPL